MYKQQIDWKKLRTIEELYELRRDLLDTRKFLQKNKWKAGMNIDEKTFKENTDYAIFTCDTFLEQCEKKIKQLKRKKI